MLFQLGFQLYKYSNEMDYKISNLFYAFIFLFFHIIYTGKKADFCLIQNIVNNYSLS